jgi:hypothetical protein
LVTQIPRESDVYYENTIGFAYSVCVDGNYAYVADYGGGLAVIDISDPTNPGTPIYEDTSGNAWGVCVRGDYAYMAVWDSGMAVVDISDPTNPGTPIYEELSGYAMNVYVSGDYAYVAGNNGLAVIDISDPTNPGTPVYEDTTGRAEGVFVSIDLITCNVIASDLDAADILTPYYSWYVNNVLLFDQVETNTLNPNNFDANDNVSVIVRVFDGMVMSDPVEFFTIIGNNMPVFTQEPDDLTVSEENVLYQSLSWVVDDENPDYYEIFLDDKQVKVDEMVSDTIIFLFNSSFTVGTYSIECKVYDTGGQMISDTVTVEVIDITAPEFSSAPQDATFSEGGPGFTLEWRVIDQHPGNLYEIYVNSSLEFSGTSWDYNAIIEYSVFGLSKGEYNFEMVVYDSSMNNATDAVRIFIVDDTSPTVDKYDDAEYIEGTTGNLVNWECSDNYPSTYEIFIDSVFHSGGTWDSDVAIILNIDGLTVGVYNYTIVVMDASGNSASNTIEVRVIADPNTDTDDTDTNTDDDDSEGIPNSQYFYIIGGGVGAAGLIVGLVFLLKNKMKNPI